MAKKLTKVYICSNCGDEFPKWTGQCPSCQEWNTLEESVVQRSTGAKAGLAASIGKAETQTLSQIDSERLRRIPSGFSEFDRVLGRDGKNEGFIEGQVALISGDPGVGKSTLLLEVLISLANSGYKVVYASSEESQSQVAARARRLKTKLIKEENFRILSSFDADAIIAALEEEKPQFAVIDSIQTISTSDATGIAGGVSQVRACASKLVSFAKERNMNLLIVGHINKEGNIAGPKTLEHLVDSIYQMEGDERSGYRIIRSVKNRFGATNEVGILGIDADGMTDIKDASEFFVSNDDSYGVARSAVLEGNRVLVVEIQALTNPTVFSLPKRIAQGVSVSKLQVICAILQKYAGIRLGERDVYVNIAGGLKISDPSIDLAIAMAIASSAKSKKIPVGTAILGELSLTGRVGNVTRLASRESELKRLGYKNIVSERNAPTLGVLVNKLLG